MNGRIDAHHHVWTLARGDYGWLTPALAPIHRDFSLDDLRPLAAAAGVTGNVLVQAAPTLEETRFLLDTAIASGGFVKGVVGWVDLASPDACATLAELSRDPLLRGIRPMLQDLEDPRWILRPEVAPALDEIARLGLAFDALVTPRELPALLLLAERHPTLRIVVDHGAKPRIAQGAWEPWAGSMRALAGHPHIHCKLSGLVTEAGPGWRVETLRRYVDHLAGCFGPGRLIWGSDWPVVDLAGGYARWDEATQALLQGLAEADRAAVLGENARRFYRLGAMPDGSADSGVDGL